VVTGGTCAGLPFLVRASLLAGSAVCGSAVCFLALLPRRRRSLLGGGGPGGSPCSAAAVLVALLPRLWAPVPLLPAVGLGLRHADVSANFFFLAVAGIDSDAGNIVMVSAHNVPVNGSISPGSRRFPGQRGYLPRRLAEMPGRDAWPGCRAGMPGRDAWRRRLAETPGGDAWRRRLAGMPGRVHGRSVSWRRRCAAVFCRAGDVPRPAAPARKAV
jgi:hypothetical protein